MIPHFTNTTAFWALLAIPLITAIHFLQHKTKTQATATLPVGSAGSGGP